MSQNLYIDGTLQIDQPMAEVDTKFWNGVLKAAIYDPKDALEHGIEAAIKEYQGNDVESYEDWLEDGDEFEETDDLDVDELDSDGSDVDDSNPDDSETDSFTGESDAIPTFTLGMNIVLSGCYFLDDYIADANKVAYQAGMEKGVKVCLKIAHTYLDRGPDDDVTMKWHEMVKKFSKSA